MSQPVPVSWELREEQAANAANLQVDLVLNDKLEALAAQQSHANEEVDHFIERSWGLLLTAPSALHLVKGDTGSCAGRTPSQQPAWWSACMHRNACSRFSKLLGCAASRLRVVDLS